MQEDTTHISANDNVKLAVISTKLEYLTSQFDKFDVKLSQNYINREEHAILVAKVEAIRKDIAPLKQLIYGLVALVLVAVVAAVLKVVVK